MGTPTSSSAGEGPPRVRSIRSHLIARLAVPVGCLVVLCALAIGAALGGAMNSQSGAGSGSAGHRALVEAGVLAGVALVVVICTVLLVAAFARRLSHEVQGLTEAARKLADEQLPRAVRELHSGQLPTPETETERSWGVRPKTAEVAAAVGAITSIERTAIEAAAAEARLRDGLRQILMSLGRRNQSLLHRQLKIIDQLEQQAVSPGELADLFTLDHLTTRMRRHAESLTILSGASSVRSWSGPVAAIDVIRAAVAEIEDYKRVSVATEAEESVAASAVTDLIHLLAELIENATLFSPSATRVEVRAERVANGFAIEVEDRGLGIAAEQLKEINARLASPPDFDLADADRLGLFVAGRLAARHGVQVELIPSAYRGTKAVVVLPEGLITTGMGSVDSDSVLRGAARLNVGSPEALSLVGATAARPTAPAEPLSPEAASRIAPPRGAFAVSALLADPAAPGGAGELGLPGGVGGPSGPSGPRRRSVAPDERVPLDGLPRRERPAALSDQGAAAPAEHVDPPVPGEWSDVTLAPSVGSSGAGEEPRRLPRRMRPGSAEQLASGNPVRMPGTARPAEAPAPERARNLAASVQSSWQRSREADDIPETDLAVPDLAPDSEEK
jgi:signal transduction histidine kinase